MVKGPKFLNPADKARKEARKKELKKNKKQRQQVRSAVIENKNPEQILAELEQLDKQEYDPDNVQQHLQQPTSTCPGSSASDLLYKEKRKRLKELFARCLAHYEKEDTEKHAKLKALEADYELKHKKIEAEFEAVKAATEVTIDDIFLPPEPVSTELEDEIADDDPLMSTSVYITLPNEDIKPPSCPPGPPPDLKQLVESLKSPVLMQTNTTPHMLPAHLMNTLGRGFHSHKRPPKGQNSVRGSGVGREQQRKRPHYPPAGGAPSGSLKQQPAGSARIEGSPITGKPNATGGAKIGDKAQHGDRASKSAVIESKPVIFMPKATKFVPASVRAKVGSRQQEKSDTG